jgi:hypothetical protein
LNNIFVLDSNEGVFFTSSSVNLLKEMQTIEERMSAAESLGVLPLDGPQIRFDWNEPFTLEGEKSENFEARTGLLSPLASSDGDLFGLQQEDEASPQQQEQVSSKDQSPQQQQTTLAQQQRRGQELKRGIEALLPEAPSRRKKKPKSLPKRPLSAYNLYFQHLRADLNQEGNVKVGFHDLGKIVGKKWKALGADDRNQFQGLARIDSERYKREMEEHKKREAAKEEEEMKQKAAAAAAAAFPPDRSLMPENYGPLFGPTYGPSPYGNQYQQYSAPPFGPPPPYESMPWSGGSQFALPSYAFDSRNGAVPGMPPMVMDGQPKDGRPLPPGSQVQMRDEASGEMCEYTVQYAMVTMSRHEANDYMERLKRN